MDKDWAEFKSSVCNIHGNRVHKIKGSFGVYDSYKWIRKNKWLDLPRAVTEHEFYKIIRTVNNYFADNIINGHDITLPQRMGKLELRKYETSVKLVNGRLITSMPIDWDSTLKLWYEDREAYNNKTLLRMEEKEVFRVFYNKYNATYNNKIFYTFKINRDLKQRIKYKIKHKSLDAFKI